jgi:AcrR family transcriptional regulator
MDPEWVKLSRRDRLRVLQKEAILEAAEEVFATEGFHRAKMRDIAAKADFATGSLYNYFSSKEDIFVSIMERRMDVLFQRLLETVDSGLDFITQVEKLAAIHVAFMDAHRSFFTIFASLGMGAKMGLPVHISERSFQQYQRYAELVEALIQEGIKQGIIRDLPPKSMAAILMGVVNAAVFEWCSEEPPVSFARKWPLLMDFFFNGVLSAAPGAEAIAQRLLDPDSLELIARKDRDERTRHRGEEPTVTELLKKETGGRRPGRRRGETSGRKRGPTKKRRRTGKRSG